MQLQSLEIAEGGASDHAPDVEILGPDDGVETLLYDNPFSDRRVTAHVPAGLSINEAIQFIIPNPRLWKHARVWINGPDSAEEIPRVFWGNVRLKPNAKLLVRLTPSGGGGKKSILGFILSIVIIVAAFYLAPVLAPSIVGATGIGLEAATAIAFSAVTTIGKALVSALIPPPKSTSPGGGGGGNSTQRLFAITGVQNRAAPFEAVPRAYGRMRYFPAIAATPYNEILGGNDVYLRMLFDFGPGPLKITELKIGDTPIENFDDVQIEVGHTGDVSGNPVPRGTYYAGFSDDRALTLYPTSVSQTNESVKVTKGLNLVRSFPTNIVEGRVVCSFPQGLVRIDTNGAWNQWNVIVQAHYREIGTGTWFPLIPDDSTSAIDKTLNPTGIQYPVADDSTTITNVTVPANWDDADYQSRYPSWFVVWQAPSELRLLGSGGPNFAPPGFVHWVVQTSMGDTSFTPSWWNGSTAQFAIKGKTTDPFFYSFRTPKLDPTKNYEFRLNRVYGEHVPTTTSADDVMLEAMWLSSIQGYRSVKPTNVTGHALMALRIRSSEQLNGTLQTLSAKVEALLPVWNGTAWVQNQITRNPAWIVADILRGNANAKPVADSRLDLAGFKAFADWCDGLNSKSNPRAMFDGVFDSRTTVIQAIQQVLSVQRASFAMKDGKFSIIYDAAKTTPVQLFTTKNSSGFSGKKMFFNPPHALKVRFTSEDKNYTEDELTVYADGYTATNATLFEQIECFGITRAEQAYWFGRYLMAQSILRPEVFTIEVDVENLVCRRGDLVRVQHDVPRWGAASGRVRGVTTVSGNVTALTIDETVIVEVGKTYALRGRKSDGTIILANLSMGAVATETNVLTLQTATPIANMLAVGDLFIYGETTKESIQCLVRNITRVDDLKAQLELIDYAPDVFTSDTETIPAYSTQSTWQNQGVAVPPAVPVVFSVVSDETALVKTTTGYDEAIRVTFAQNTGADRSETRSDDYIECRYGFTDGHWFSPTEKFLGNPGQISITRHIQSGGIYHLQFRRVTALGLASAWSTRISHTVIGKSTPPTKVFGFNRTIRADDVLLYWDQNTEVDIVGYELRVGGSWAAGTKIEPLKSPTTVTTQYVLPPLVAGTYTYWVRALDEVGLQSVADSSVSVTITAPSAPTVSYIYQGTSVVLTWSDVQTSHRVSFYKIKMGAGAATEIKTTTAQFPVNWTGSMSFEVWGVDVAGNEGTTGTVTVTNSLPTAPANLTHSIVGSTVQLGWDVSTPGSLPIRNYEVRYGGTSWSNATFLAEVLVTTFTTSANWTGARTIRVAAKDTAGNYGSESTRSVTVSAPSAPTVSSVVSLGEFTLSWTVPASTLPVKEYEVRTGASYAAGTLVAVVSALSYTGLVTWSGTQTFWVVARTENGLESSPTQRDVSVTAPNAPSLSTQIVGANVQITWGTPASNLPVARYEIRVGGTDWATATFVAFTDSTVFVTPVTWSGSRVYRVAGIDTGGNVGSAGVATVLVTNPGAPTSVTSDVIDNNVLLRWQQPSTGTLPILLYRVKYGASWAAGTSIGDKSGTFTSHFQTQGGTFQYWIAAVDTANNEGTPTSLSVTVNSPPDYILRASVNSTLNGTLTNAVKDGAEIFIPAVTGQTWQQHFDLNGSPAWTTPQNQIDAGYPIYIQPTTTTAATYVETYDYGTTISTGSITIIPTYETVAGSITWSGKIEVSTNGTTWTTVADPGWTGFTVSFRYVRFTVKAVGAAKTAVGKITAITLRIDVKQIVDSGVATCNSGDAGGTTVNFTKTFIDVDSITVTPRSTTACYAIVDFTDVPNPTSFKILVFDSSGTRVTKDVGWTVRGV